jgi:hypothetical protein
VDHTLRYSFALEVFNSALLRGEKKFGDTAKFSVAYVDDSRKILEALLIGKHYQFENTLPKGQEGRRNKFEMEFSK